MQGSYRARQRHRWWIHLGGTIIPIHVDQFMATQEVFPSLIPVAKAKNFVYAITVKIEGIVGSGSRAKIQYHLFVDLTNFPNAMPDIFIVNLPDHQIKHINVYHPKPCAKLNGSFPYICIGNLKEELQKYRHLMAFLQGVRRILNSENEKDPARRPS